MEQKLLDKFRENKKIRQYLRENSEYYKLLNRKSDNYKIFMEAMKDRYKLRASDKINNVIDGISTVNSILDALN